jgi:hypothetical protein
MLLAQVLCILCILLSLFIAIKPLKIMDTIRAIFILKELDKDDYKVFLYRLSGIAGVIVFALFLLQTFTY